MPNKLPLGQKLVLDMRRPSSSCTPPGTGPTRLSSPKSGCFQSSPANRLYGFGTLFFEMNPTILSPFFLLRSTQTEGPERSGPSVPPFPYSI